MRKSKALLSHRWLNCKLIWLVTRMHMLRHKHLKAFEPGVGRVYSRIGSFKQPRGRRQQKNPQICIFDNGKQYFCTLCTCIFQLLTF